MLDVLRSALKTDPSAKLQLLQILKEAAGNDYTNHKKSAITRNDYPAIVKLKLAGNSDKAIAKKLGVQTEQLKPHLTRALSDYRSGKLLVDGGETVKEARKAGAKKSLSTTTTPPPRPISTPSSGSSFSSIDVVG